MTLTDRAGKVLRTVDTQDNHYIAPQPLAPGEYCWRVEMRGRSNGPSNCFHITPDSPKLEDFAESALWRKGLRRPFIFNGKNRTRHEWRWAIPRVEAAYRRLERVGATSMKRAASVAVGKESLDAYQEVEHWSNQLLYGSMLHYHTGQPAYLSDIRAVLADLGAGDVFTPSYRDNPRAARSRLWALAYTYDVVGDDLGTAERNRLRLRIEQGIASFVRDIDINAYRQRPNNATHANGIATLLAAAALLAPDSAIAREVLSRHLRWYVYAGNPFGAQDGGYLSGGAYLQWNLVNNLPQWDAIRAATRFNPYQHIWLHNVPRFFAYALPPGAPESLFGDGHETPVDPNHVLGLMDRVASPYAAWYAAQFPRTARKPAVVLSSAAPAPAAAVHFPAKADAALFPDSGIVAMHRQAGGREVSIYLKADPRGSSINHSHADQGAFLIHANGKILAGSNGAYDWYGSPHWKHWYRNTVAHNVVTFDGGQGQPLGSAAPGVRFVDFNTGANDTVAADLTGAYGGALTRYVRGWAYLRPNLLVVRDLLASATPRRWEWNLHSTTGWHAARGGYQQMGEGARSLCVKQVGGPDSDFVEGDAQRWPLERGKRNAVPWHARFVARAPSASADYLFVLDIGCRSLPAATFDKGQLAIDRYRIKAGPDGLLRIE
ncbi:heparinase II/III family protein [Chitiniphilus purpureus]|uniref:Heparinase II/III family protein n=1 Tax=Chitiniphilus purpureus TaxID=2981137 RepID=A0ABY6DJU3_9NEIS|nr:heparinase II/III family protein [Chitiniphilus sp. CD1]UXY14626.1 heparinase II/III family protein [Chitiniphilus sp. CD1]